MTRHFLLIVLIIAAALAYGGNYPKTVIAYRGAAPTLDGLLSPGEWDDADGFVHDATWNSDAGKVKNSADYSMSAWVKNDGVNLYFAFDVTDDVIYGRDIAAWLPEGNAKAHELSQNGWPWFADGIEIFLNPQNQWNSTTKKETKGDGASWKVVCSSYKSRLGGVGVAGLMEGEPRSSSYAWDNYQRWIVNGAQQAVVRLKDVAVEGNGFIIEWKINANPCLEVQPGKYWSPALGVVDMGMNVEIQDLDSKTAGAGNWSNFHHIDYWAAEQGKKELLERWGTLRLTPEAKPQDDVDSHSESLLPESLFIYPNYPNPFNSSTTLTFSVTEATHLRLDLLNVQGTVVHTLWNATTSPGHYQVVWQGADQAGHALPSGMYFCRLQSKEVCLYTRLMLLK